jgi:hypothetical protein
LIIDYFCDFDYFKSPTVSCRAFFERFLAMGISKFLGVGAKVTVKATNLKPKAPLQAKYTNTYDTTKVQGLVIIEGLTDTQHKLVKVRCASPDFINAATGAEIVFECKAGCCHVTAPAPEADRFEVRTWCFLFSF